MAIEKYEIFLASRFEEFSALRSRLREKINNCRIINLHAIDLNDGLAGGRPPLAKCLAHVEKSEILVLLVGDSYGGLPAGQKFSYTHLEYKAASKKSSKTIVLPFFIGESSRCKEGVFSSDVNLKEWQQEILNNHTPAFYGGNEDVEILSQKIIENVLIAANQMKQETTGVSDKDLLGILEENLEADGDLLDVASITDDGAIENLDARLDREEEDELTGERGFYDLLAVLKKPAEAAANEQRQEAILALKLNDRLTAIKHLRKALEIRPLDLNSNHMLARQLMVLRNKTAYEEAKDLSLRAARLAENENRLNRAASSYILAARSAANLGNREESSHYARKAHNVAPWLAATNVELACQLLSQKEFEKARNELKVAFQKYPQSLHVLASEPVFLEHKEEISKFKKGLKSELVKSVEKCLEIEEELYKIYDNNKPPSEEVHATKVDLKKYSILRLASEGKKTIQRILDYLDTNKSVFLKILELGDHKLFDKTPHTRIISFPLNVDGYNVQNTDIEEVYVSTGEVVSVGDPLFCFYEYDLDLVVDDKIHHYLSPVKGRVRLIKSNLGNLAKIEIKIGEDLPQTNIDEHAVEGKCATLIRLLEEFDNLISRRSAISPTVSIKAANVNDIVLLDKNSASECGYKIDNSLLPVTENRHEFINNSYHNAYRLIVNENGEKLLARWAVYFNFGCNC